MDRLHVDNFSGFQHDPGALFFFLNYYYQLERHLVNWFLLVIAGAYEVA